MSRKLSFEDALKKKMNSLPTPDADKSWDAMSRLLNKEKKRPVFFFLQNSQLKTGFLLLLSLLVWLMISPEKKINRNKNFDAKTHQTAVQKESKKTGKQPAITMKTDSASLSGVVSKIKKVSDRNDFLSGKKHDNTVTNFLVRKKNKKNYLSLIDINRGENNSETGSGFKGKYLLKKSTNKAMLSAKSSLLTINDTIKTETIIDTSTLLSATAPSSNDSFLAKQAIKDSLQQMSEASTSKALIPVTKRKSFFIDAGVQLQQQIPVSGQVVSSYYYNGTKTLLPDYLPLLYLRLEKKKHWFLQGEFSYAAPRFIRPFSYSQKTQISYAHSQTTTTNLYLKKTWYTALPLSFHYYVQPGWTIGAGIIYNRLRGAVSERKTSTGDARSGIITEADQMKPVKGYTDSFLYQSNTGLLLQTGYIKNRWSIQLRLIKDLQPFIAYTLPDGTKTDKKNTSLQLLIGYRFFRYSHLKKK